MKHVKQQAISKTRLEARIEELAAAGKLKKGTGTMPDHLINETAGTLLPAGADGLSNAAGMSGGLSGVTLGTMKTLDLADVSRLPEELEDGEPIELRDGDRAVAKVIPIRQQTLEERIDELVAQGKARRGTGTLPDWFFTAPRPKCENGSVLEQLLSDRRSKDY